MKRQIVVLLLTWGLLAAGPVQGQAATMSSSAAPADGATASQMPPAAPAALRHVRSIQVTPDPLFARGGFVRVWQAPATGNLIVTFGGWPTAARIGAARQALQSVGGSLEAFYYSNGEQDFYIIVNPPDNVSATAITLAGNASGTFRIRAVALMTPEEMDEAVKLKVDFCPPGQ